MAIAPLVPGAFRAAETVRSLRESRAALDDLQRQLVTGKRAETFGGLKEGRFTALSMRAKLVETETYRQTIAHLQIRAKQMDLGLSQLVKMSGELSSTAFMPQFDPDSSGKTSMQRLARLKFDEAVDVLNLEVNGQHLFAGRKTDARPVLDARTMLEGDAAGRAGVLQMIAERKAADLGTGTGRLTLGGVGTAATLAEDGAHPFGFKLTAGSSTAAGITSVYAAGPPATLGFTVTAPPADGDEVRIGIAMPDGTTQTITLVARAAPLVPPAGPGAFEIGATNAATAQNLRDAIALAAASEAATSLPSASAKAAADAFFAGSPSAPPLRVVGPPATATALAAGSPADTVIWYQGDDTSLDPRATLLARVESSVTVALGAQANEEGFRRLLANLAVFASETFADTPQDRGRYQAMSERARADLRRGSGVQRVETIQLEIGLSANAMQQADERHRARLGLIQDAIAAVEDVPQEEAAAKLLALQTRMQASYQTTAILSRLSLVEYLR